MGTWSFIAIPPYAFLGRQLNTGTILPFTTLQSLKTVNQNNCRIWLSIYVSGNLHLLRLIQQHITWSIISISDRCTDEVQLQTQTPADEKQFTWRSKILLTFKTSDWWFMSMGYFIGSCAKQLKRLGAILVCSTMSQAHHRVRCWNYTVRSRDRGCCSSIYAISTPYSVRRGQTAWGSFVINIHQTY